MTSENRPVSGITAVSHSTLGDLTIAPKITGQDIRISLNSSGEIKINGGQAGDQSI